MKQQLILTISLGIIFIVAVCLKLAYFPRLHGHTAFYFQSTFWICGLLIIIMSLNMLWSSLATKKGGKQYRPYAFWPNRRETFRIIYPAYIRPMLIVEAIDGSQRRQLEFAVVDLSQEGGCFIDDGSLGEMETFSGYIRFKSGDTVSVAGEYIRKRSDHVSVRFSHAISWPILLQEQRRILVQMKPIPRHLS